MKDVTLEGKNIAVNTMKTSFVYPGLAMGVSLGGIRNIKHSLFMTVARSLTSLIPVNDLK